MQTEGIPQIAPQEAQKAATAGALIVDVREIDEWVQAHIPQAVHIPMSEIQDRIDEVPADRLIIIQCHSGIRSQAVAGYLAMHGLNVANLAHGIQGWARAGLPVE